MVRGTVAVLLVEKGPNKAQMIPLLGGKNIMGRQLDSDVVDTETEVSRKHAEIVETDDSYHPRDLSSSNDTYVNGNSIESREHSLVDGDRIQLGPSKVIFVFKSDRANTAVFTLPTQT